MLDEALDVITRLWTVFSPMSSNSAAPSPLPTPNTNRPPESRSTVVVSRASFCGRLLGTGVTVVPIVIVVVAAATAPSATQGSTMLLSNPPM